MYVEKLKGESNSNFVVQDITEASPFHGKIKKGDFITKVNGSNEITSSKDILSARGEVKLEIIRHEWFYVTLIF